MVIDRGYYKVEGKRDFFNPRTTHYMRVFYRQNKKYIQLDHGAPALAEDVEEDVIHSYVIIKRITRPIEIKKLKLTLTWEDEDGDKFTMVARNAQVLEHIFSLFPRLKKVFGYE